MTALHVYIDESIRSDGWYRLTAVEVATRDLAAVTRELRKVVPRGQYRVHFSAEGDARRRRALRALVGLPISATTFLAPYDRRSDDQLARDVCLHAFVRGLKRESRVVVIDSRGAHRDRLDRLVFRAALLAAHRDDVAYSHRGSRDELLLALPDALGWAVGAQRPWRQMVAEVVTEVRLR